MPEKGMQIHFSIMRSMLRMIRALLLFRHRKTWGPFVEAAEISGFDHGFTISWSQKAEDIALLSIFENQQSGTYLDLGAHHPTRFSVTRHLYQRGWHGVNVDANQMLINNFIEQRPRDINICTAVGNQESYEFTIFEEAAISTIDPEWKKKFLSENNKVARIEIVKGRTLRDLYDEYYSTEPVDLLTIDAEGSDFVVLESLHFNSLEQKRWPKFIMLETSPPVHSSLEESSVQLAISYGYLPWLVLPMATILKSGNS
jgi:FkbM family methyltransferase